MDQPQSAPVTTVEAPGSPSIVTANTAAATIDTTSPYGFGDPPPLTDRQKLGAAALMVCVVAILVLGLRQLLRSLRPKS